MKSARANLFPVINGVPLRQVKVISGYEMIHPPQEAGARPGSGDPDNTYDFYFDGCASDPDAQALLESIAKRFTLWKSVRVTVGLAVDDRVEEPESLVNHPFIKIATSQQPILVIAPEWKMWWLTGMILTLISGFILLAATTDILKARDARLRPNGARQWSLSHLQLAFWFFVVFLGFFYLWSLTGKMEMPTTAVTLCGIALVTALGGESISRLNSGTDGLSDYNRLMLDRRGMTDAQIIALIKERMSMAQQQMKDAGTDSEAAKNAQLDYLEYQRQLRFMQQSGGMRWLLDLLSENGDITLHRFQMLAWTFGVGAIFLFHVVTEMSMPELPGSLVALMGLSAGTYLGFRIPEAQEIQKTLLTKGTIASEAAAQVGGAPAPVGGAPIVDAKGQPIKKNS